MDDMRGALEYEMDDWVSPDGHLLDVKTWGGMQIDPALYPAQS